MGIIEKKPHLKWILDKYLALQSNYPGILNHLLSLYYLFSCRENIIYSIAAIFIT